MLHPMNPMDHPSIDAPIEHLSPKAWLRVEERVFACLTVLFSTAVNLPTPGGDAGRIPGGAASLGCSCKGCAASHRA